MVLFLRTATAATQDHPQAADNHQEQRLFHFSCLLPPQPPVFLLGYSHVAEKREAKQLSCYSRPFLSTMVFRPNRPDSHTSRSASIAIATRASLGCELDQLVTTSTGVLVGMQASRKTWRL